MKAVNLMSKVRKKALRLFLKKPSVRLAISIQSFSLEEFFIDIPLQC